MKTKKSQRFAPLTKQQVSRFDQAARENKNTLTKLTCRTLLHTGMRNGAFCHLRESWVADERILGKPVIRIPEQEGCTSGVGTVGQGNPNGANLTDRGEPCFKCRKNRDGYWTPKTSSSDRPIPVMEEDVHKSVKDWFANNEQIPLLHQAVANRVSTVAEEAGIEREVKPHDLRNTYGTLLARMDVPPEVIREAMGHGSVKEARNYVQFVGRTVVEKFKEHWDFDEYR